MKETTTQSLKSQSAWLLFAKVVGFVFSFLLPLLVVRFLSQENVGVYRQVFQVVVNLTAILPLGIPMSAYYFLARETERRPAAVLNILIVNLAVGGFAFGVLSVFPGILGSVFHNDEVARLSPLVGAVVWVWVTASFLEIVAVANQEARLATAFIILSQFAKTLFMVAATLVFATVDAFLWAALIQGSIQAIVLAVYLASRFPGFWRAFDPAFFKRQMVYALPFGFAGLLWTLQTDVHNYFVGNRFSAAEYAIYAYGCFQLPLIGMLSESVTSVLIPRMSALQAAGDRREMLRLTFRAMEKLAFFYFPIYVFLMITASTFVTTLFTRAYEASVPIFLVNLTLLPFLILITDPIVRSFEELGRFLLLLRVFVIAALLAALAYGVGRYGLTGVIAIVVVVTIIEKTVSTVVVLRKIGFGRDDFGLAARIGKTAAGAIIAGVPAWLVYDRAGTAILGGTAAGFAAAFGPGRPALSDFLAGTAVLGATGAVFAAVYLGSARLLGLFDDSELLAVSEFANRIRRFLGGSGKTAD
jgi:O-antigen/teichoic acid export membrane protein